MPLGHLPLRGREESTSMGIPIARRARAGARFVRLACLARFACRLLPAGLLLAFAAPSRAAGVSARPDRPDTAVYVLPLETVVTASRLSIPLRESPAATTVLTRAELERSPRGLAVGEALASVPGLRIDAPADAERVHLSIRGQGILAESGIRGIKVLLDGLPLNDPTGVAPDLYDVDWATVDRAEVLRGPSAALYGGGGSGGVLNLTTARGAGPLSARGSAIGGSYGYRKTLAELGGSSAPLDYRFSVSQAAADGYRDHNAFWSDNAYGKLRYAPRPGVELEQVLAWTDYDEQNAEGLNALQVQQDRRQANPDAAPFDERFKTSRFTGGLTGRVALARDQALRFAAYVRTTRYLEPRPRELVRKQMTTPGLSLQYDLDSGRGAIRNHASLGGEASWQAIDKLSFYNPGRAGQDSLLSNNNIQQRGQAVFALDRIELPRGWSVTLGGRYDYIFNKLYDHPFQDNPDLTGQKTFRQATGRVGVAWAWNPYLNLYANWGQGFLPPSTEELVNNPLSYGGFNQDLVAATSSGEEVGARGVLGRNLSYELCGFRLDTDNDFDRYRLSSRPGLTFYRNSGASRRWGTESRASWKPLRSLAMDAAYTWSWFRYTSPVAIDGHFLPNSPAHQLALDLEVRLARDLTLGVDTEMQSQWELDTQNSAHVPGFALWNAGLEQRWRAGGLAGAVAIGARNVFGASYMAYTEPDPDGNSYQPGPKQEYFARLSLSR
jgi:iron complex outermembrane receptor protein